MATKTAPKLSTVEALLDEVEGCSRNIIEVCRKLKALKPGSEAYHDLLPELWVQLAVLEPKLEHALQFLDEYEDSLPEEEDSND